MAACTEGCHARVLNCVQTCTLFISCGLIHIYDMCCPCACKFLHQRLQALLVSCCCLWADQHCSSIPAGVEPGKPGQPPTQCWLGCHAAGATNKQPQGRPGGCHQGSITTRSPTGRSRTLCSSGGSRHGWGRGRRHHTQQQQAQPAEPLSKV